METSIIVAGFGGQGVLFTGKLLAYTGMDEGKQVTWFPSYGPEMRGGTAHCTVIISDEPIGAPLVAEPDIVLALNLPSFDKYEPRVKAGGTLVVNSSIVPKESQRDDIQIVTVPANDVAEQVGTPKMVNMAMLGAMLAFTDVLSLTAVAEALVDHLPASKADLLEQNIQVLQEGARVATAVNKPVPV
ncbi:MAG: 2-oxoacid:ferredoxin oxidoreductase subunit gamma [Chloroflexi bacterium]|nr:2-oxoacid:ferredoxin oxidoreductase subunit gamma [Chloroflexota bacterium]